MTLLKGHFPIKLKEARFCPIHRKGDQEKCSNYGPISLLSNMFYDYDLLLKENTLYDCQFGFQKGTSTTHALVNLVENIRKSLGNKKNVCGVFVDLQTAFDL